MDIQIILLGAIIFLLLIIAILLIAGAMRKANLRKSYPPKGQLIDVGGYRLHIHCQGQGSPAVILDAGQGESGFSWAHIQSEIANTTQVCAYDRAGLGWSDPSLKPRTAEGMVEELHTLLDRAGVPQPYILVGASLGGLNARVYAHKYPDEVAGLVLVDAAHEQQYTPEPLQKAIRQMSKMMPVMVGFAIFVVKSGLGALFPRLVPGGGNPMAEAAGEIDKALRISNAGYLEASVAEIKDVELSHAQVRQMNITSLGDLPMIVIRHGKAQTQMMPGVTGVMEETNQRLQAEVAAQSTRGRLVVAEQSGHAVQFDEPELVSRCILEILEEVRQSIHAAEPS